MKQTTAAFWSGSVSEMLQKEDAYENSSGFMDGSPQGD